MADPLKTAEGLQNATLKDLKGKAHNLLLRFPVVNLTVSWRD